MSGQSGGEKRDAALPTSVPSVTHSTIHIPAAAVGSIGQYQALSKSLTRPINLSAGALGGTVSNMPASAPALSATLPVTSALSTSSTAVSSVSVPSSTVHTPAVLQGSTIVQIGSTATLSIPAGTIPVSVSSILKGTGQQQSSTLQQQSSLAFPAHIPRGAVAAASALAGPKSSMQAVPIVRHPVSSSQHSPSTSSLQSQLGQRGSLIAPVVRTTTPNTSTRSPSPAATASQPPDIQRGPITIQSSSNPSTVGSIQITLPATRVSTDVQSKPLITQHPKQVHQIGPSPKIFMSQSPVTPILQHSLAANLTKTTKGVSSASSTLSSATPTLSSALASSVTAAAPTIPIAKVPPVRQHQASSLPPHTVGSTPQSHDTPRVEHGQHLAPAPAHSQPPTSVYIPTLRTTPSTTGSAPTTAVTAPVSSSEIRADRPAGLQIPSYPLPYLIPSDYAHSVLMYQQMAMIQANAAHATTSSIRPGALIPNQNPNLTASLQAATAHGLSVTAASAVRFNHLNPSQMMVTVDALRQQQAALSANTPFSVQSTSTEVHDRPTTPTNSLSSLASTVISSSAIPIPALSALGNPPHTAGLPPTQSTPSTPQHGGHTASSTAVSTPNASPRPSILRKRPTNEGPVKKPVCGLNALLDRHSPRPDSRTDSAPQSNNSSPKTPHTPAGESQSSTDTALSSEATTPTQNSTSEVKIKQEPPDHLENGFSPSISQGISSLSNSLPNSTEASPRKKPRKQLLNANEELKDAVSSTDDDEEEENRMALDIKDECEIKHEYRGEYVDDEGVRWTVERCRPNVSLLNFYNISWKPRNNHFQRYTDVKSKDERRPTVNELSNQRGVMQKASGWKLYHMAAQMEDLNELEKSLHSKLLAVQASVAPHPPSKLHMMEDDLGMLHELTQANIQRSQLIMDQLQEARGNMLKVLDHKHKITEIINKHMSKRPIKKKER